MLNYSLAEKTEFTQHLKEIGTAQLRELEIVQGNAGRGSHAGWKDIAEIVSGLAIVAALCRAWGAIPSSSGKTVWGLVGRENQL